MMAPVRVGLLPLYIELYDRCLPALRTEMAPFVEAVRSGLTARGLDVHAAPVCCVAGEFNAAVADMERRDVDIIVALHLAYSPSLESIDALARSNRPLLLLDTTMDFDFGPAVEPGRLSYNHGIHGVQDLACMLRRRGRPFQIVAGHVEQSHVLDRAAGIALAARAAKRLRESRVLRIGQSFVGMGDFAVDDPTLARTLGVRVTQIQPAELGPAAAAVSDADIDAEIASDRERFDVEIDPAVHRRSVRLGLALRRRLDEGGFTALSANFLAFDSPDGPVDTVPFLEISKAMARGIGYAGEGDVLTAALVGALLAGFERTTFTEIFCPDWKGNSLFLSHMGEINPRTAASRPRLIEKPFPFTRAKNPAFLAAAIAPGPAVYVNLAPGPGDSFRLIGSPVESLGDGTHPAMRDIVRGWFRPPGTVANWLEQFSRLGGTHHSAMVLGESPEPIAAFAEFAGLEFCAIDAGSCPKGR